MHNKQNIDVSDIIATICKGKKEKELQAAELNFIRYLQLAERIYNRISLEDKNTS